MNSSIPNIAPAASPKPSSTESAAADANRRLADEMVKAAIEGLNRLTREKAAAKDPRQAA